MNLNFLLNGSGGVGHRVRGWGVSRCGPAMTGIVAVALVTGLAPPQTARAAEEETPDVDLQAAKSEFENAQTLFIEEQYEDAATHFLAAYARKPFPAFLFNAAVSYEKGQKLEKAGEFF